MAARAAKLAHDNHDGVTAESHAERLGLPSGSVTRPLTLTKGLLPVCVGASILVGRTVPASSVSWQERRFRVLPNALLGGSRENPMKLLKTAFWLGVVIYYLPSPAFQSSAPASHVHGGQGLAAKAASKFCTQSLARYTNEALPKRGEPNERDSSRDALSQDTLTPADRAVPWCGPALRMRPMAKRSI